MGAFLLYGGIIGDMATTKLKEASVPCNISAQRANLVSLGESGMGNCESNCQICRNGGRVYVIDGVVVECSDGIKIYNQNLVVELAKITATP